MKWQLYLVLAMLVCAAACGTPGAPRPPSLELPRPVSDLKTARVGGRVTLTWTAPRETTDRTNIRRPGPTRICREVEQVAAVSCDTVGEVPPVSEAGTRKQPLQQSYTDVLPDALQLQHPSGFVNYSVAVFNDRGKTAGLSNQVQVPLAPTLPPPTQVKAEVTADGIKISAYREELGPPPPDIAYATHVYGREEGSTASVDMGPALEFVSGKNAFPMFTDRTFDWEKTYFYHVAVVTTVKRAGEPDVEVLGESSPEIKVVAHDVFPPAMPVGLQAVASGVGQPPFVDMTWAPNTESDLAGYNVYRHEAGQPPVKINPELVKAPAYRDSSVERGHKYFYAVSAVDLRGNESTRSEEASEAVP